MITYTTDKLQKVLLNGGCEQNDTPTPDNPIDIVCNNGAIKVRHQSGLPLSYTLLDYIESNGTQYINTGLKLNSTDKVRVVATTGVYGTGIKSRYFFGVYNTTYGFGYNYNSVGRTFPVWANNSSTQITDFVTEANTQYDIEMSSAGVYVNGSLKASVSGTFTGNKNVYLLWANGTEQEKFIGKLHQAQIWKAGILTRNLVPCKNASNVVGMYDLVNDVFYQNAGNGDFTAGSIVSDPVEIYTVGAQEVVTDNLGNTANAERLLAVNNYKDTQEVLNGSVTKRIGIKVFDGTETWDKGGSYNQFLSMEAVTDRDYSAGRFGYCTHFTMTSDSSKMTEYGYYILGVTTQQINFSSVGLSATTVEEWKQWLADQYANGTPVIVVYLLTESTTEQVTPQQLAGSTATVTAGSIDNLPIESSTIADLKKRYIGDKEVKKVYIGENIVYNRNN